MEPREHNWAPIKSPPPPARAGMRCCRVSVSVRCVSEIERAKDRKIIYTFPGWGQTRLRGVGAAVAALETATTSEALLLLLRNSPTTTTRRRNRHVCIGCCMMLPTTPPSQSYALRCCCCCCICGERRSDAISSLGATAKEDDSTPDTALRPPSNYRRSLIIQTKSLIKKTVQCFSSGDETKSSAVHVRHGITRRFTHRAKPYTTTTVFHKSSRGPYKRVLWLARFDSDNNLSPDGEGKLSPSF